MNINLGNVKKSKSRVFSGREFGKSIRTKYNLDDLDNTEGQITIKIPDDTISMNSSFFLGLFDRSIIKLGEDGFREKYKFICSPIIDKSIEDGINRAQKNSNALD
ncbi:hypothetical protein A0U40_17620 [[Bacillus] sp. KCTC 13219]|nr:hypothetical protein A0U40_17620 [[Bacillus] sp. KCTC 13219]